MRETEIRQGLKGPIRPFRVLTLPFALDTPTPLFSGDCVIIPGDEFADLQIGETIEVYQSAPAPLDSVKLALACVVGVSCTRAGSVLLSHALNDQRFSSADQLASFRLARRAFPNIADHQNVTAIYLERVD